MSFTEDDRAIIEVREMLMKYRNKDAVAKVLHNRGMDEQEATDFVYSIYKANLSANRKASIYATIISGAVLALMLLIVVGARRASGMIIIFLVASGIGFLWGGVKFLTASGYEIDED
jgi:hypothetical protein